MEHSNTTPPVTKTTDDDIDLEQLFNKTGGVINNLFAWLSRVFLRLGTALLLLLFFFRKNLIWLILGAIIGMGYGIFLVSRNGSNYYSEMTVRTNFKSTRLLYGTIDFFNALINNGQTAELSKILNITRPEAASLIQFQSTPVVSETITVDMYNDRFLKFYHNNKLRIDTFWTRTIDYKDFKSSLTKYDYPVHQVKVISHNTFIFSKIQPAFLAYISNNELPKQEKANSDEVNKAEIDILVSSIQSLDTLRNTYNRRLSSEGGLNEKGNYLTQLGGNITANNPELELYDKMLELKDELKIIKNNAVLEKNILQIYSPFGPVGQKVGFLEQKVVQYALYGLLAALMITSVLSIYKVLHNLEKKYTKERTSGTE